MRTSPDGSMATSPSSPAVEVVGGGAATPEQIAALTVALQIVLAEEAPAAAARNPWRWPEEAADWRRQGLATHPSRP